MLNLFSPIMFYTDVNSITLPYFMGTASNIFAPYPFIFQNNIYSQDYMNYQNPFMRYWSNVFPVHCSHSTRYSVKQTDNNAPKSETPSVNNSEKYKNLNLEFLNVAKKYSDCNEQDGSHLKFCVNPGCTDKNSGEWCTDFVTYVTKESYRNKGLKAPDWFGSHDVNELKNQAIENGKFLSITEKKNPRDFVKHSIKKGDIVILNENGASHCGFVTEVNRDGSFKTIEGNRYDKVAEGTYGGNDPELSGFIRLG